MKNYIVLDLEWNQSPDGKEGTIDHFPFEMDERKNGSRGQRFKKENNPEYDGEKSQQAVHPVHAEETFKPGDFNQLCDAVDDKADAGADAGRRQGGAGQ